MPPRSRMYSLQPHGIGTGEVESATSYVSRLAAAHTVTPWALVKHEIAPRFYGQDTLVRNRLSELFSAVGSAFNGENGTSKKIVSILQSLTGRRDLGQMTMGFCRGIVSSRLLLRSHQAWCPLCLGEWEHCGRPIYMPLLWNLRAVRVCPHHGIPLLEQCHACARKFYPLKARSKVGHCPACGAWLGNSVVNMANSIAGDSDVPAIAQRVMNFLTDVPRRLTAGAGPRFAENAGMILAEVFAGNIKAFATFAGMDRTSVKSWANGMQVPSLLSLADLSLRSSLHPADLLFKRLDPSEISFQTNHARTIKPRAHKSPPRYDLALMRKVLKDAVREGVFPRPSLKALAKELGCHQSTLTRRFPELAKQVKLNFRRFMEIRAEVRSMLIRSFVRGATIELHNAGYYPSLHQVRSGQPSFVSTRDKLVHQEWKKTMKELGLSHERRARDASGK